MDSRATLRRYIQTRRFSGRRGVTPMRTKHRKPVTKTRSNRVEKRSDVSVRKHTISCVNRKWKEENEKEHRNDQERKGDKDCDSGGGEEDKEECSHVEQRGDSADPEESVHPGLVQTLSGLLEQTPQSNECADDQEADQTEIEAEVLL